MSDTHGAHDHDHGHGEAGHEIDKMPNARLFNLLFGLSALTLVACIGVVQLFNMQVAAVESQRAEQGSFQLAAYRDEMKKQLEGTGTVEVSESDGSKTTLYYGPLAQARKAVLDDPTKLKAGKPYPGWKTADDQAPAAAAAPPKPAPAPVPVPAPTPDGAAKPTDAGTPTGKPTDEKVPSGADTPTEGKTPTDGDKPERGAATKGDRGKPADGPEKAPSGGAAVPTDTPPAPPKP